MGDKFFDVRDVVIAARDSQPVVREHADFVCDGHDDDEEINAALVVAGERGSDVLLGRGTFVLNRMVKVRVRE